VKKNYFCRELCKIIMTPEIKKRVIERSKKNPYVKFLGIDVKYIATRNLS